MPLDYITVRAPMYPTLFLPSMCTFLFLSATPVVAQAASRHATPDATAFSASLSVYLDDLTKADQFAGAVLVARRDMPVFVHAYGKSDR